MFGVCDKELNWIVNNILADEVEFDGDCLYIRVDYNEIKYYDLKTGKFSEEKPESDFEDSDGFNINSIPNLTKVSGYINGMAAVLMWNRDVSELYMSVINEEGEFLFNPVKTPIKEQWADVYFDGTSISIADSEIGSKHNPITICTYDLTGLLKHEWCSAGQLDVYGLYLEYNEGVFVIRVDQGQYSAYYRQLQYIYYTPDFQLLY